MKNRATFIELFLSSVLRAEYPILSYFFGLSFQVINFHVLYSELPMLQQGVLSTQGSNIIVSTSKVIPSSDDEAEIGLVNTVQFN
jgi:hypothetical protein